MRKGLIDACTDAIGQDSVVLLSGSSGCGKSVILRMLSDRLDKDRYRIFCSEGLFSGSDSSLNQDLRNWTGQEGTLEAKLELFQETISRSNLPCIILLDSIDRMKTDEFFVLYSKIVSLPPEKATLFLSTSSEEKIKYLSGLSICRIDADKLQDEELIPFMKFIAARSRKALFDEVCNEIAAVCRNSHHAFYLSMLIDQLVLMSASTYTQAHQGQVYEQEIIRQMMDMVHTIPDSVEEIITWKLRDMNQYVDPSFSTFLFELMSVYGFPLPLCVARDMYEECLGSQWNDMHYYMYRFYLRDVLTEKDGKLFVTHNIARRCISRIFSKIDERMYLDKILKCLAKTNDDPVMMYITAGRIQPQILIDAIRTGKDAGAVASAMDVLFWHNRPDCERKNPGPFWNLYTKIAEDCGFQTAIDTLILLISRVGGGRNGRESTYFYCLALQYVNRPEVDRLSLMKLTAALATLIHGIGMERMAAPVINCYLQLISEKPLGLSWYMIRMFQETEVATHYVYRLLQACDRFDIAKNLQDYLVKFMQHSSQFQSFYPSIVQDIMKDQPDRAMKISNKLLKRFEHVEAPHEKAAYGNLMYAHVTLLLQKHDTDAVDRMVEKLFKLFRDQYVQDNLNLNYAYNYSLGLSARLLTSELRHDKKAAGAVYRELITLRNHLCRTNPDSLLFLRALSGTVWQVVMNNEDIGIDHRELLEMVYGYTADLARRGNPRACWEISSMFKASQENETIYRFFIEKLMEIETFLDPIMELNRGNKKLAMEIVYTYLQIFKTYCDMRILPVENGHYLLVHLYKFAKNEFLASPDDMELAAMVCRVHSELISVELCSLDGNARTSFMQDDHESKKFRDFAQQQYDSKKNSAAALLLAMAECTDIVSMGTMVKNIKHRGEMAFRMFLMLSNQAGVDVGKSIADHCTKVVSLFEEIIRSGNEVPEDILVQPFAGFDFMERELRDFGYVRQMNEAKRRLLTIMPEELRSRLWKNE